MNKLSIKQINNLMVGTSLACELPSTIEGRRAFLVISVVNNSKYINTNDSSLLVFWLRKYEIKEEYIINDWDVSDDELEKSIHLTDIIGIEQLEIELSKYLDDFRELNVEWACENPL